MVGILANNWYHAIRVPITTFIASGSRTNFSLNAAFVNGSGGPSVGLRFLARSLAPIEKLYVMMDDVAGTLASITMEAKIWNEHVSSASQPGSTLRATSTACVMPNAVDKWIEFTFDTPYSPAAIGEVLWFTLSNTSAVPGTNYPLILVNTAGLPGINGQQAFNAGGASHTSGFTSAGAAISRMPHVVVQGGIVYGGSFTTSAVGYATSTSMKGIQIKPPTDIEVCGFMGTTAVAMTGLRIYDADTPPAGTPLHTFNLGSDAGQSRDEVIGAKFWAPIVLQGGRLYNVVYTYATTATMSGGQTEDYASYPAVFDALIDYFNVCPGVLDTAGAWVVRKDFTPGAIQLQISDFPKQSRASYALGI